MYYDESDTRQLPRQCNGFLYRVQPGDSLFSIAQHFRITFNAILNANPQITNPNVLSIGQMVCVPGVMPLPTPIVCSGVTYNVRSGDTLTSIGRRFNVSVSALLAANPIIRDPNFLVVGLTLCIPGPSTTQPMPTQPMPTQPMPTQPEPTLPPCSGRTYVVRTGDTLTSIGRRFNVSVSALLAANPIISDPNYLVVGLILCIPNA